MATYTRQTNTKDKKRRRRPSSTRSTQSRRAKSKPCKMDYTYLPKEARGLNDKQRQWCEEYLVDLNATEAAKRAGYSKTSANVQGTILKKNRKCQRYVAYLKIQRAKRLHIDQDRVVEQLARIAYQDHRTFYDNEYNPIALEDITDDQQSAIKKIYFKIVSERTVVTGVDEQQQPIKERRFKREISGFDFYNRVDALRMLGHHIGMSLDKPSEKPVNPPKRDDIDFEMILRKLHASQLEQLTAILTEAAKQVEKDPMPENDLPSDHWSQRTMGGEQ